MENLKLVHQLFIGKVADEIGTERTTTLLKEAKEAFAIPVVVSTSCDLTETELKNKIRLADIDYHLRKERS